MSALFAMALIAVLFVARSATATIVVAVPFQNGVVAGSDRRGTIAPSQFLDNVDKLHAAGSALIAVTNLDRFWLTSPGSAKAFWTTPPAFVLADAIVAFTPAVVRRDYLPGIAQASARTLGEFIFPFKEQYVNEKLARVAYLLPEWQASYLLTADAHGNVVASAPDIREVGPDMPIWVRALAQGEYLQSVIDAGLVSPVSFQTLHSPPIVRDMTFERAVDLVEDLIESAARAATGTAVTPPLRGIGGGLDLWAVTRDGPHHLFTK